MKSIRDVIRGLNVVAAVVLSILAAALFFVVGWVLRGRWEEAREVSEKTVQVRSGGDSLINPLLDCELAKDTIGDVGIIPFRGKVLGLIEDKSKQYKLTYVSVYFRELNDGTWFGINEQEHFAPASLLKVPLMIAWLKQAESTPGLLSKKIRYRPADGDYNDMLTIKPSKSIAVNRDYSAEDLIRMMIIYSDNNANTLLFKNIDGQILLRTYRDLGVEPPLNGKDADFMTVKEYASVFKILFNTSYLNRDMSAKALQYLSEAEFKAGLVSGVPHDIRVAHKFGERVLGERDEIKELHDCGIVYYPKNPYLLCVMTRGTDFSTLDDIIADVSRTVYGEVDTQHKEH